MVSIRDVAKHAGVAISTVSKVLHNYPNISEDTRTKVNTAIRELGYIPNSIASALSSKNSGRIAFLMDPKRQTQAIDQVFMQYLLGAIDCAKEMDLDAVTLFFSMLEGMDVTAMTRYFLAQNITGIVIFGMTKSDSTIMELVETGTFSSVLIDVPYTNEKTSSISIDHRKAQYDVARETILDNIPKLENDHGPQKILYISGNESGYVTAPRLEGMKSLAEELKLDLTIVNGHFSEKNARDLTFKYGADMDVIVCASDLMAIGAMNALIDMDIFHPVCGFDGITLMGYVGKQMNTVKQDFYSIAHHAVEELSRLMQGESGREITMPHSLVRMYYKDIII